MIRLIFHTGSRAGTEINTSAPVIKLGRDPAVNDLVLDDREVSARHCILTRSPRGAYVLEDVGSANGTWVNERRIAQTGAKTAVYLAVGDRFRVGVTAMEVGEGQPRLMVIAGGHAGRDIPIGDEPVTIGRASDNVLEFNDPDVSAYHAAILCLPEGFVLQDNRSTNGTFVDEHRIERHVLTDGASIRIGKNQLRFLIEEPAAPAADLVHQSLSPEEGVGAHLVFISGPHQGATMPLGFAQVVFGRRDDCTFSVNDLQASGAHCAITRVDNQYKVTDLQSTNGTFVNGARVVHTTALKPGDLVEFGKTVAEFRMAGGGAAASENAPTAMATVLADGAYLLASQPKYILDGHVTSKAEITIGRSPSCDFILEGQGISALHCTVVWDEDGFYAEDCSRYGTYIADRRVVREKLATGHVLRIGRRLINVTIRGERCTLESIDAATAMAAIEVARENAFNLASAVPDPSNSLAGQQAYRTVFKLELPDTEAMVRERKAKFKEGAPAWRPSTDILPDSLGKTAVFSAAAAAVAVAVLLYASDRADALINHPLSAVHTSARFAGQAGALGLGSDCSACHSPARGVPDDKCTACHTDYKESVRPSHLHAPATAASQQVAPGGGCVSCHSEHKGEPRLDERNAPTMLGASRRCSDDSCHPNQHAKEFLRQGPPPPTVVPAGRVPTFSLSQEEFHVRHAVVKQAGRSISIGCTTCHARKSETGALIAGVSGQTCFFCHQGGEEFVNSQCASCHRDEHRGVVRIARLPPDDPSLAPVLSSPTAPSSLLKGAALALAAFLPLCGLGLVRRVRRRRMAEKVVRELAEMPTEVVKRLVHSINMDKCVGCSMCVAACPASVLELVNHKSVVVNFDACIQCRKCEVACAFDALRMHEADKPPPMIQMPEIDRYYQTQVEGMYLVGQASGTPQVKNASNLGRAVVQHMVMSGGLTAGACRAAGAQVDVIIVGTGPAGLSAALSCAQLGLSYLLLEKQRGFSWTIRSYYHKGKPVMAEPHDVEMIGLLPHWDTTREELLGHWEQVMQQYGVQVLYSHDVTDVKKQGAIFFVTVSDRDAKPVNTFTALRVVLAIGTMGNPRKLGCPGDDLEIVHNALVDPDEYVGKNILVAGGTDSAIEVVLALCQRNKVWLSCRGAKFDRVKPKNLQLIDAVFKEGKCEQRFATTVKEVRRGTVVLEHKENARLEEIPNDAVFAMIGGHPPIKWLQSVGVSYTEKPHSWSPPRTDDLAKETANKVG
jgi:pSer/pThr/pTyr-binding forkhead associated (FHA) protein/thioredoxin reductase/formate hydrogenlyase subunit 6/NADH:ubiquinone oxidoreductase subunit I